VEYWSDGVLRNPDITLQPMIPLFQYSNTPVLQHSPRQGTTDEIRKSIIADCSTHATIDVAGIGDNKGRLVSFHD
jgi:hypothetical protein